MTRIATCLLAIGTTFSVFAGRVETVHNAYYEGLYDYMFSVFGRVSFPIAWFPDRIVSKDSQANIAALYAMSEIAAGKPFETNKPSTQAYSFTSAGKYEPLKQRDLTAIASHVSTLSDRPINFYHSVGLFAFTPWCFNPVGTDLFATISPAGGYGVIKPDGPLRVYSGKNVGLGGLDFNWQNIFAATSPNYLRTVARTFWSLCNVPSMGITNVVFDTSSPPTDIVDLYRWSQDYTTTIAPWESKLTMQNAWLWNAAPIVGAFNTVFWRQAGGFYFTSWRKRLWAVEVSLLKDYIKDGIQAYQFSHPNPEDWGSLPINDCVVSTTIDEGEEIYSSTNMTFTLTASTSASGGLGLSFVGPSAERYIGTVTLSDLTTSGDWTDEGVVQRIPSTSTDSSPRPAQKYTQSIGSPISLDSLTEESGADTGTASYMYEYNVAYELGLNVSETPFGSVRDSYWADKAITEKSCYTGIYVANYEYASPSNILRAGVFSSVDSDFYNSLRGSTAPRDLVTSTGLNMMFSIPSETPTWDMSVAIDMREWLDSGETDRINVYYYEDDGTGNPLIDIFRVDDAGNELLIPNTGITLSVSGRRITVPWVNDFDEFRRKNMSKRQVFAINFFGAVVVDGMLNLTE